MNSPKLSVTEQQKWNEQGWTLRGALRADLPTLAASLGVAVGRAAAIQDEIEGEQTKYEPSQLEKALAGDVRARGAIYVETSGLPWVVMNNGTPDPEKTQQLIDELKARPAARTTFQGLYVCRVEDIAKAKDRLPRCQLTGVVLDAFNGKLYDGNTGADWARAWLEPVGNGRILMLAHARRKNQTLIPAYAVMFPDRAAQELSAKDLPPQWQRVTNLWASATPVEKALAEEALFLDPVAVSTPPAGETLQVLRPDSATGKPVVFILSHPRDAKAVENLRQHCAPMAVYPAELRTMADIPVGQVRARWLAMQIEQATIVVGVMSADLLADDELSDLLLGAIAAAKRVTAFVARPCSWQRLLGSKQPLAAGRNDPLRAAADLRACFHVSSVAPSRPELRRILAQRLPTATAFEGFCLDHFKGVYREFSSGMDRTQRTTLLFERTSVEDIMAALGQVST